MFCFNQLIKMFMQYINERMSIMRHNENIKMLLAAGLLTLGAWEAGAQITAIPNSWNVGNADYGVDGNWLLDEGGTYVPNNNEGTEYDPEFAVIDNGGTANISGTIAEIPLAVVLGYAAGTSGNLVMTAGELTINGIDLTTDDLAFKGQFIIGNEGAGTFTMSGGTLNTPEGFMMSRSAGGSGSFTQSGGIVYSSGAAIIGAGGGEAAVWNMTGGAFNQLTGEIDVAGNGLSNGTLNMSGGTITITEGDLDIGGNGGGTGTVSISGNSIVNVGSEVWVGINVATTARFTVGGTSTINTLGVMSRLGGDSVTLFKDQATINMSDALDIANGKLRVEGHQVNINANNVILTGTYNPTISSNGASVIQATGSVNLGGTLELDFDGVTANVGDSWRLIEGAEAASGQFATITGADLGKGIRFATVKSGNNVDVAVETALTFVYNTASGKSSLIDHVGGIGIKAYSLTSSNGSINSAAWNSLSDDGQADWDVVSSSDSNITELMVPGSGSVKIFSAGEMKNFGQILAAVENSTMYGESLADLGLKLRYTKANGENADAILEIQGTKNNLVLHVDKTTGHLYLQNHSTKTVNLKGYTITSGDGELNDATWESLSDGGQAGWEEAGNGSADQLTEFLTPGSGGELTLNAGDRIDLGLAGSTGATESFLLRFFIDEIEGAIDGAVMYDSLIAELESDWDLDGDVDADDLAIVQAHFGDNADLSDLFAVRNNFGNTVAALTAVPEPASLGLLLGGLIAAIKRRRA